jgi:50S ribosomal subunit-associated GTPase HflX
MSGCLTGRLASLPCEPTPDRATELCGRRRVALVGLFPAKDKEFDTKLDLLATSVEAHGGRVVSRHVQRRGVSHGGAGKMTTPFSRRTLLSSGKAREVADACRASGVDVAVFANPLTEHQRAVLNDMFDCLVISSEDLFTQRR